MYRENAKNCIKISGKYRIYDYSRMKGVLDVETSWKATDEQNEKLINKLYEIYLDYIEEIMSTNNGNY